MGGEPQARSSSFACFFSVFASLAEALALQAPEGGGVQLRQGAFFPLRRARVELAVKARSSSLGCRPFFFPCQDEKLNAAETRASVAEARVLVLEREKARPFFFSGLGGTRKPVLQVELMKEIASQARFPSFFSPPFWGGFPGQATRLAVLEEALRGEKAWTQGFQARCRSSSPPPCPPVAPRQADAIALRRELEQLKAHPSAVEIDRLRIRARAPRRRLRSVAVAEDPLAVVFPLFFRSIPRRSVSPARPSTSALTWKKRSGPRPFFCGVFSSAERALRSAEWALRSAERAQCRAGT